MSAAGEELEACDRCERESETVDETGYCRVCRGAIADPDAETAGHEPADDAASECPDPVPAVASLEAALGTARHERSRELIREALQLEWFAWEESS